MHLVYPALLGSEAAFQPSRFLEDAKHVGATLARRLYVPCPEVELRKSLPLFLRRPACVSVLTQWGQINLDANRLVLLPRAADELDHAGLEFFMGHLLFHRKVSGPEWLIDLNVIEALDKTDVPLVETTAQAIAGNPSMRQIAMRFKIGPRVLELGDRLNADIWADSCYEPPCAAPRERRYP